MMHEEEHRVERASGELEQFPEIRRIFDDDTWYYSITDVIQALTGTPDASDYWLKMKRRGKSEGFEATLEKVCHFPMKSRKDGKLRSTECVDRETLLRLVQSIPSMNQRLEDVKLWLAQVGEERLQSHEITAQIEQVRLEYRARGRDEAWINDRILNLTGRNALTDQWKQRGAVQTLHFGLLTNILHKGALGVTLREHGKVKGLPKKENPREHMDRVELALLTLTEATSTSLHIENDSQGIEALKLDAQQAARAGKVARSATEKALGRPVVSATNFLGESKQGQRKRLSPPKQPSDKQPEELDELVQEKLF
jgi:hypothetical protein